MCCAANSPIFCIASSAHVASPVEKKHSQRVRIS